MKSNSQTQARLLQESLQALEQGETLDDILSRYPEQADALRPRLQAANWLAQRADLFQPRPAWLSSAKQHLLAELNRQATPRSQAWRSIFARLGFVSRSLQGAVIAVLVLLFMNVTGQALFAARLALPGDLAFSLKYLQEQVRLALSISPVEDAILNLHFAQERTLELEELILEQRYEDLPLAVNLFQRKMSQFEHSLEVIRRQNPQLAQALQQQMEDAFQDHAIVLSLLIRNVPHGLRANLEQALLAAPH